MGMGVAFGLATVTSPAGAEEKTVIEEILGILKAKNQISDAQYEDLLQRAKREEEERVQRALEQAGRTAPPAPVAPAVIERAPAEPARPRVAEQAPAPREAPAVVAAEPAPAPEQVAAPEEPPQWRVYWKDALRFDSPDGDFSFRIGGRIQLDTAIVTESQALADAIGSETFQSGVEFRRARLYTEGRLFGDFGYKFEYDFADQQFKDVWLVADEVPGLQQVILGHQKEPFSLEEQTSANYITFMERGLNNVFSPVRNTGLRANMDFFDERATWAVGVFRNTDGLGEGFGSGQDYNISTRVTGIPWHHDAGHMLHLGLSYSHQFRSNFGIEYAQRPESHLAPQFVRTEEFVADSIDLLNPELALILGPFSLQAEYTQTFVRTADDLTDPRFFGWYAYVSWFLTGEHREYDLKYARFTRVRPKKNFGWGEDAGWGAFEAAARFSQLNLDSGGVQGGRMGDTTLGMNWYLNPNFRIMMNYVYADVGPEGSGNVYECRFQVDF